MTWTDLSQRPSQLRELVLRAIKELGKSPQFYFQEKLGVLSDSELEDYVQRLRTSSSLESVSQGVELATFERTGSKGPHKPLADEPSLNSVESQQDVPAEDIRQVRSLGWLRKNGLTQEDRAYAEQLYRETILDLWCRYVAQTGETYYPPLQNELLDEYTLISNE